jgi:hypothetical protein
MVQLVCFMKNSAREYQYQNCDWYPKKTKLRGLSTRANYAEYT